MKNKEEINQILCSISNYDVFIVRSKVRVGLQSLILAPLIRLFTKSKYNHAGLISDVFAGNWIIVEADEKGFRPSCYLKDWLERQDNFIIYRRNLPSQSWSELNPFAQMEASCFERMMNILYKPYDFASTLFYQVIHLLSSKKAWIGECNAKRVNCSEAVAYVHGEPDYYKFLPADFEKSERYKMVFKVGKGKIIYNMYE